MRPTGRRRGRPVPTVVGETLPNEPAHALERGRAARREAERPERGNNPDWSRVATLEAACRRLPRAEAVYVRAMFRNGKWPEAVAYAKLKLSFYN